MVGLSGFFSHQTINGIDTLREADFSKVAATAWTEAQLRSALFRWIRTVITTIWQGVESVRPASGTVEMVWHMQGEGRPGTPFIEGRLGGDVGLGRDVAETQTDGSQTLYGDREIMLYLAWFGPGAMDGLKAIRNAAGNAAQTATLYEAGIAIRSPEPVLDAHQYLDTMPEDRATLDLRLGFVDSWNTGSGQPGVIESAGMSGKIDGKAAQNTTITT